MKRLLILSALLVPGPAALAADLPGRKPAFVPPPPAALAFEGLYVGVHAGAMGFADRSQLYFAPTNTRLASRTGHGGGFIGGVHAGYDWRYGNIVAGLVGDVSGAKAINDAYEPFFAAGVRNEVNVQGSVRGRVGYAFDRVLVYATGGLNVASLKHDYRAPLNFDSKRWVVAAPTVGVGVEYAVNDRWSAGLEYRVSELSTTKTDKFVAVPLAGARHQACEGAITASVNYRFGK